MNASQNGLNRERVAELIVAGGNRWRGSGYRVTATTVLTAAHVVHGAESVRVRFEADLPGEWSADAVSWWCEPDSDIAVVVITPRPNEAVVTPARFGRIVDRAAVLAVQAVGFPRWKLRADTAGHYRDACHAVGSVPVLSNWREGTLDVAVEAAPERGPGQESPWEGMSGAAVWAGERIIGVLARHHPSDGVSRLAAVRLDRVLTALTPDRLDELRMLLPSIPADLGELPDVLPVEQHRLVLAAYRAQLIDIAPEVLHGRDDELDELVRFCTGEATYAWWQAGPWAGKSALLSWFALHPPAGMDVVSFFVTSRFAGESDSDAFVDAVLEQLAVLNDEPAQVAEPRAKVRHLLRLLQEVGQRCAAAGRRLVLVVDGLDEDTSRQTGAGMPSIAALLPRRPPAGVRVLVASRPHPGLPVDVPADHPLLAVTPRPLGSSPYARGLEITARNELDRMLRGSNLARDVLGLITACGGGLSQRDLEDLTGLPAYELGALFGSVFGRTIEGRTETVDTAADRVYLFAHETLRQMAVNQYGASVATYRTRLDTWAEGYRVEGWPPTTPAYLLRGYPRLLAAEGDTARLLTYATDEARHRRLREVTGGNALSAAEVARTTGLILRSTSPDFGALLRLAMVRDALAERTNRLPIELPAVWVALGHPHRAIALATGISYPARRMEALHALLRPLAARGEHGLAATLVEVALATTAEMIELWDRHYYLEKFAEELAGIDDQVGARRVLHALADQSDWAPTTHAAAAAAMGAGNLAAARHWIADSADSRDRLLALTGVAMALGDRGDIRLAKELAEQAMDLFPMLSDVDDDDRAYLQCALAETWAACGESDRAEELLTEAELAATSGRPLQSSKDRLFNAAPRIMTPLRALRLIYRTHQGGNLSSVRPTAVALALMGNSRAAVRLVRRASSDYDLPWALFELSTSIAGDPNASAALARVLADDGYPPWVRALLIPVSEIDDLVEQSALEAPHGRFSESVPATLASALAAAGDTTRATRLAHAVEAATSTTNEPVRWLRTLNALAEPLATIGDTARVQRLADVIEANADTVDDQQTRGALLDSIIKGLGRIGDHPRAARLLGELTGAPTNPAQEPSLAWAAAAGDRELSIRVAVAIPNVDSRIFVSINLAWDLAQEGAADLAARLLRTVAAAEEVTTTPNYPAATLVDLAHAALAIGDRDHAHRLARAAETLIASEDNESAARLTGALASSVADYVDPAWAHALLDSAESLADTVEYTDARHSVLGFLARYAAEIGYYARALRLTDKITNSAFRDPALADVAAMIDSTGDHDKAARMLAQVEDAEYRARAWNSIAETAIDAGDHTRALACADTAETATRELAQHSSRASHLWPLLATTHARLGDHAKARGAFGMIIDPQSRAYNLNKLVTLPGGDGYADLVADTLTTDKWLAALPAVTHLDPATAQSFCDAQLPD